MGRGLLVIAILLSCAGVRAAADPATEPRRKREESQRRRDIEAAIAALETRRAPENIAEIQKRIAWIGSPDNPQQCANDTGFFFRPGEDTEAVAHDRMFSGKHSALETLAAFSKALRERGTDLILLPVPNAQMVYSHRLIAGTPVDADIWPGYTKGLIALLKADVEVLDVSDAFRSYAGPGAAMHRFDNHWATAGREIAARMLAARLSRYAFDVPSDPDRFVVTDLEDRAYDTLYWRGCRAVKPDHPNRRLTDFAAFHPAPFEVEHFVHVRPRPDDQRRGYPVYVTGDSMVFHKSGFPSGSGFTNLLSKELGFLVPFEAQRAGARTRPRAYMKDHFRDRTPYRVVVLVIEVSTLAAGAWPFPDADEPGLEVAPVPPLGRTEVVVTKAWRKFDLDAAPYDNALATSQAEILSGPQAGRKILLVAYVMRRRAWVGSPYGNAVDGTKLIVDLRPMDAAIKESPLIGETMTIDETEDYDSPQYYVVSSHPAPKRR